MSKTLPIPFGTYGHTPQYVLSKDGSVYTTAIGSMGGKQPWKSRVWRITADSKAEVVFETPAAIALHVVNGELLCVWVDPTKGGYTSKIVVTKIEGYIPIEGVVSSQTVDINEAQVGQLKQQLGVALAQAAEAKQAAASLTNRLEKLQQRVASLESRPQVSAKPVDEQKIADIVWAKLWDTIYILRMGMNAGFSTDVNVAGWINDLTSFVRKVSNGK
jgi:hypothetical protein